MRILKYADIETWARAPFRKPFSPVGGSIWHGLGVEVVCQSGNKASADNLWMLHEESNVSWNAWDETVLFFLNFRAAKHLLCICNICFCWCVTTHTRRPGNNVSVSRAQGEVIGLIMLRVYSEASPPFIVIILIAFFMLTSLC